MEKVERNDTAESASSGVYPFLPLFLPDLGIDFLPDLSCLHYLTAHSY